MDSLLQKCEAQQLERQALIASLNAQVRSLADHPNSQPRPAVLATIQLDVVRPKLDFLVKGILENEVRPVFNALSQWVREEVRKDEEKATVAIQTKMGPILEKMNRLSLLTQGMAVDPPDKSFLP
jgi:hypothetical protein